MPVWLFAAASALWISSCCGAQRSPDEHRIWHTVAGHSEAPAPTGVKNVPRLIPSGSKRMAADDGTIVDRIREACRRHGLEAEVLTVRCPTGWMCPGSKTEKVITIKCRGDSQVDIAIFDRTQMAIAVDEKWLDRWSARSSVWKGDKKIMGVGRDEVVLSGILGAVISEKGSGLSGQGFPNFELCASRCAADFPRPLVQVISPWCASMRSGEGRCGNDRTMIMGLNTKQLGSAVISAYWMGLPCVELFQRALDEATGEVREAALSAMRILAPQAAHRYAQEVIVEGKYAVNREAIDAFLETIESADAEALFGRIGENGATIGEQEMSLVIRSLGAARWLPGVQWLKVQLASTTRVEKAIEIIDALGRIGNRDSLAIVESTLDRFPSLRDDPNVSDAICRLKLDWYGEDDIRIRLTAPQATVRKGESIPLMLQIDNRSLKSLCRSRIEADLRVIVDGKGDVPVERARFNPLVVSDRVIPFNFNWAWSSSGCRANEMDRITIPAKAELAPGTHNIYVEGKEMKSNVVRVVVE